MPHNHQMSSNASPAGAPREEPPTSSHEAGTASITMATSVPKELRYKARSIVFTIYDLSVTDRLRAYAQTECKYMRFGHEVCPTTNRPHLQGWLQWTNPRMVGEFWQQFGHPHVQPRRGTVEHNQLYTSKEKDFEEFGTPPSQGKRTDWTTAVAQLRTQRVVDVVDSQPHLLPAIRALERYQTLSRQPPKDRDVRVLYIYGTSGCGKTRSIHAAFPDAYWKPNGEWWDGYDNQEVVVLDDFYGDIQHAQLLRVLDRYPLRVPVKGGFTPANWTTVIISSNANLEDQYSAFYGERRQPFYRRIHRVIHADNGISAEHITNALREAPQHPQVYAPAPKADDPSPSDHYVPRPSSPSFFRA